VASALEAILDDEKRFESEVLEHTRQLVLSYYDALNSQDLDALEELTSESVACDVQPTERMVGRGELVSLLREIHAQVREHVFDIEVMVSSDGIRAAAEFTVLGFPLAEDRSDAAGAPGQTYRLPGGTFFEIANDRIVLISSYGECGRPATGTLARQPFSV